MAATRFFATNAKNTSTIDNNNYLIWSDNGQTLGGYYSSKTPYRTLNRKWMATASGNSISNLPVNLKVKTKDFFAADEDSMLYMAISRTGDPELKDAVYVRADSLNSKGYACFNNLHWDTDKSGRDLFTFAVLPKQRTAGIVKNSVPTGDGVPFATTSPSADNNLKDDAWYEYKLWPNPTAGDYQLQLTYPGPTEVTVNVFNSGGTLVKQFKGRDSNTYWFTDNLRQTGYYMVRIETRFGIETMKIVVVK